MKKLFPQVLHSSFLYNECFKTNELLYDMITALIPYIRKGVLEWTYLSATVKISSLC